MTEPRAGRVPVSRADLPDEFTPDTVRELPLATLRRLADHRNQLLSPDEQRAFDQAMHEVMGDAARRVSRQLGTIDWSRVRRDEKSRGKPARAPQSRADKQLARIARRIGQQVDLAETLAPNVDWSFAQAPAAVEPRPDDTAAPPDDTAAPPDDTAAPADDSPASTPDSAGEQSGTVGDLEQRISEQVELVQVMSEIAEVSKRTYSLEQQRDLQNTRTLFFGLVVSIAVLVAGWAPLVAADDWTERIWIIVLTLGTCLVAAGVYGLVRYRQNAADDNADDA